MLGLVVQLPLDRRQLPGHDNLYRLDPLPALPPWSLVMNDRPGKTYRPWNPLRYRQQAHAPATKLPEGDLVFFLLDLVPHLDLQRVYALYEDEARGAPPFDPALMVCLLLYVYCGGVHSSRKSAR